MTAERAYPGFFITLEGGEGAGKSTQARILKDRLTAGGHTVVLTREPGGTDEAEALRGLLLDGSRDFDPMEQVLLLYAARHNHWRQVIRPALTRGAMVICDRFTDSTRAYQGAAGGLAPERIERIHRDVLDGLEPDLTLILDMEVGTGLARAAARNAATDRFESADTAFHARLRQGFLDIAARDPDRCCVIDAAGTPEQVAAAVALCLNDRLSL